MKTQTMTQTTIFKALGLFALFMMLSLAANPLLAQTERTVKGIVTDDIGPLEGATIVLKGTSVTVETDEKGAFTFPQKLKEDDKLEVIQLGYKNQEVRIDSDTTFVKFNLTDYDIVIVGSLMMGSNATPKDDNN